MGALKIDAPARKPRQARAAVLPAGPRPRILTALRARRARSARAMAFRAAVSAA